MRILLINPKRAEGELAVFPLGLAYIAAVLSQDGYHVDVADLNVSPDPDAILQSYLHNAPYGAIGITGMIINFKDVQKLSKLLKHHWPHVPIILGGGLATAIPEIVMAETGVDIAVLGEGEITVRELIKVLSNGQDLSDVKSICFRLDGNTIRTPLRHELVDVNKLPFPAWDMFPMEAYLYSEGSSRPHMDIITGRGCPYGCTFCFSGIFGRKFRARSTANILQELEVLRQKYNVSAITIRDDTFVLGRERVVEFCNHLVNKKIRISWSCNGRVNLMNRDMLRRMRKAGCTNISYGIESGNPEILAKINKRIELEKAKEVIKITREEGLIPLGYFIIGMPGETAQTIQDSIDFCKQSGIIPHFNFIGPIPGTDIYNYARHNGYISDELSYVMRTDWKTMEINMTELGDEELIRLGKAAASEVMRHHLYNYPGLMILIAMRFLQANGMIKSIKKFFKWFTFSSWSPFAAKPDVRQGEYA